MVSLRRFASMNRCSLPISARRRSDAADHRRYPCLLRPYLCCQRCLLGGGRGRNRRGHGKQWRGEIYHYQNALWVGQTKTGQDMARRPGHYPAEPRTDRASRCGVCSRRAPGVCSNERAGKSDDRGLYQASCGNPETGTGNIYNYFPILESRAKMLAGTLSGGEQQMLALGRALMTRPRLLVLDEPSLGLAPLLVKQVFALLERLNREHGLSILLVEQNAHMALRIAHHGIVLETGQVALRGSATELLENPVVQAIYLGGKQYQGGTKTDARLAPETPGKDMIL